MCSGTEVAFVHTKSILEAWAGASSSRAALALVLPRQHYQRAPLATAPRLAVQPTPSRAGYVGE